MTENTGHTLPYDGDCPFCRSLVDRWRGILEGRGFEIVPLQTEWVRRRLDLSEEELLSEMRVLTSDNRVLGGSGGTGACMKQNLVGLAAVVGGTGAGDEVAA